MIPLYADNPWLRAPVITAALLIAIGAVWLVAQRGGFDHFTLAASICNWGLVPGELTRQAEVDVAVPLGDGLSCVVDREWNNVLTPLSSMFLHGGWGHVAGNLL